MRTNTVEVKMNEKEAVAMEAFFDFLMGGLISAMKAEKEAAKKAEKNPTVDRLAAYEDQTAKQDVTDKGDCKNCPVNDFCENAELEDGSEDIEAVENEMPAAEAEECLLAYPGEIPTMISLDKAMEMIKSGTHHQMTFNLPGTTLLMSYDKRDEFLYAGKYFLAGEVLVLAMDDSNKPRALTGSEICRAVMTLQRMVRKMGPQAHFDYSYQLA